MTKITPFLWFDDNLEAAVTFYCSLFPDARAGARTPGPDGRLLAMSFTLAGQDFIGLNGGPMFRFTEAVSFFVSCKDQSEVDRYWNALTADGGAESMCGWLKDRFGLSWQIIPEALMRYVSDPDRAKAGRVTAAMLKMRKLDVAALDAAAQG
jgi:predicted 3-demethylubiquinone-9 3-methyltransferase (glyoxalase superfamily)